MGGIHAGLVHAKSPFVYVTGCDMPHVNIDFIRSMMKRLENSSLPVSGAMLKRENGHLEPLNAFYHRDLVTSMEARLKAGESGLQHFCRTQPFLWLSEKDAQAFDELDHMFFNLNEPSDLEHWQNKEPQSKEDALVERVRLTQYKKGKALSEEDDVIRECRFDLIGFDTQEVTLFCLPDRLDDLVMGWLYSNGLIYSKDDVLDLHLIGDKDRMTARIQLREIETEADRASLFKKPDDWKKTLNPSDIQALMTALESRARLFHRTGGTHNMMLVNREDLVVMDHAEDISRHHGLHKLVGAALKKERDLSETILVASCRLSASILAIVSTARIPVVISGAAVTSQAIHRAREEGISLIGFAREQRFNDYESYFRRD
jgi:formate dehydrogenase accessory protein FdhD